MLHGGADDEIGVWLVLLIGNNDDLLINQILVGAIILANQPIGVDDLGEVGVEYEGGHVVLECNTR